MSNKDWRIGIDVGGTNTDAVVLDENLNLISAVKSPTTEDVMSGIENAMEAVLAGEGVDRSRIGYAMLGTTHCTNAIVERKRLDRVAVIRIGAPATTGIRPMVDWAEDIQKIAVGTSVVAVLPWKAAVVLVALATVLTILGGFIPAKTASRSDPVKALRAE